ncbi:LysM domain-containing GPI-anchored protein 1 [Dionaea muscipula]
MALPKKQNREPSSQDHEICLFVLSLVSILALVSSKSTIEPCSNADKCNALVGYTLYTDLKVSEVATLFGIDPISLLTANSIDISYPDVENHILPSQLFLKVPISCSCVDGIRKSVATRYKTRPSDTLSSIADSVYAGLVSADQLQDANSISDPSVLDVGLSLVVPLPCTCFNGTDNSLPAVYLSYVVGSADTLAGIAARYSTTVADLQNVNSMGTIAISPGDILAVPLSACASNFPKNAIDYGLIVPNGSYAITASHCVQCSCGAGSSSLYCMPSSLAVSCSSMQCRNSNLMLGNITTQQSVAGCNVTRCSYSGLVNDTIMTTLSTSLQPQCPGPRQFPPLIVPPSTVTKESIYAPSPAPSQSGGGPGTRAAGSAMAPSSSALLGSNPAGGPTASISGNAASGSSLLNPFATFRVVAALFVLIKLVMFFSF